MDKKLFLTNWIDVDVRPVYQGFYELKYHFVPENIYMGYWDGNEFLEIHSRNRHGKHTQSPIPIDWIESWRGVCS
jgi:hypothetical protein